MDAEQQEKWDQWCDARIENRAVRLRDALGDALGETMQKFNARIEKVRQEMRDQPPLFSAPDKKLSAAMVRVGEEMHGLKGGVEALRAGEAKREARAKHTADQVAALRDRIAELEEQNEIAAKNVRGLNSMVFNVSTKLERVHALLARMATALDAEYVLDAVDRSKLSQAEERQKSAVVLSLADLRRSA
jgi:uncharacterized coiled-coil protein SlyX